MYQRSMSLSRIICVYIVYTDISDVMLLHVRVSLLLVSLLLFAQGATILNKFATSVWLQSHSASVGEIAKRDLQIK